MGRLSMHDLDTADGLPARAAAVELFRIEGANRQLIASRRTNADGRADAPQTFPIGTDGPLLRVGDSFRPCGTAAAASTATAASMVPAADMAANVPQFLELMPVRLATLEPDGHDCVPRLVSAWSDTTYRGS